MDRRLISLVFVGAAIAGCGPSAAPSYPTWATSAVRSNSKGAASMSDAYESAALKTQADASQYISRVFFTPDKRDAATKQVMPSLGLVEQGTRLPGEFRFSAQGPFEANQYQPGWQLIGKVLVWRIEDAVKDNDGSKAVAHALTATRFGFDLCGGGATDASLGLSIVDGARRALAPSMDHLQSGELLKLAAGLREALERKPPIATTIRNERENMLMAVQTVQDCYRDGTYDSLVKELGPDAQSAVDYLGGLKRKDSSDRPAYFEKFAAEADQEVRQSEAAAALPTSKRLPPGPRAEERPWKKFAKHFFRTLPGLLSLNDATIARTRLLIIESSVLATVKRDKRAPKNLDALPKEITTDPYTGTPFVYRSDGAEYRVYSVGADFRDDGGDTDESFSSPDLKLERRPGG